MGYVLSLDEGTTSTRAVIFTEDGRAVAQAGAEFRQYFPGSGLVEHDAEEIWQLSRQMIGAVLGKAQLTAADIACLGITNQRETTVVFNPHTGEALHNALVWQDTRGAEYVKRLLPFAEEIREITGLPVNTYFSALKMMWLLDHVDGLAEKVERGEAVFGTIDTWLIFKLTGGELFTDVTNASRTMLMDIRTGTWSKRMSELTGIPLSALPAIQPSATTFGAVRDNQLLAKTPITGVLGDQQAAAFGQVCFDPGDTKVTYGTGCFILTNTGAEPKWSNNGLVTTAAFQLAGHKLQYALEGSIAVAGSLVQWLRDSLGIIERSADIEPLAQSVPDSADVYFVPAFSGLYAPRWRPDARGTIVGLTRFSTKAHIARAALDSTAFQTAEVLDALLEDSGFDMSVIKVDGGMSANDQLLQFQADISGFEVARPRVIESTALGACFAAGLGAGLFSSIDEVRDLWVGDQTFSPQMAPAARNSAKQRWNAAVERSLGWVEGNSTSA